MEIINIIGFIIAILGIIIAIYQIAQGNNAIRKSTELSIYSLLILYKSIHNGDESERLWGEFLSTAQAAYSDKEWRNFIFQLRSLLDEANDGQ